MLNIFLPIKIIVYLPQNQLRQKTGTAEDASQFLIRERSISTVPWDDAGAYLRFSVTYLAPTEADEDALMDTLRRRLGQDRFVW